MQKKYMKISENIHLNDSVNIVEIVFRMVLNILRGKKATKFYSITERIESSGCSRTI